MSEMTPDRAGKDKAAIAVEIIGNIAEDLESELALTLVPGYEKKHALWKLEECVMWATKAIANHGTWYGESEVG